MGFIFPYAVVQTRGARGFVTQSLGWIPAVQEVAYWPPNNAQHLTPNTYTYTYITSARIGKKEACGCSYGSFAWPWGLVPRRVGGWHHAGSAWATERSRHLCRCSSSLRPDTQEGQVADTCKPQYAMINPMMWTVGRACCSAY